MPFNSVKEVSDYLETIPQFRSSGKQAADFNLERIQDLCEALGNPHEKYPAVHVAGTNGKGSTCYLLGAIYQQAGFDTGVYTSPHLLRFNERFIVNGQQISDDELLDFFKKNADSIEQFKPTYFELSTAIAFWYFAKKRVDIAIIEVGLGGRLDATNIITPKASIITNISLDHTDILGTTIAEIAREKAGIVKQGVPVVLGNLSREAEAAIREVAEGKNAPVHTIEDLHPHMEEGVCHLDTGEKQLAFESMWKAPVQAYNIAVAWRTVQLLTTGFAVDEDIFASALTTIDKNYPNQGRFEKLTEAFDWYFDGGHNLAAVRAMKEMVERYQPVSETVLVLSLMKDKVHQELLNEFSEFKKIFYHEVNTQRAARFEYMKQLLPSVEKFPVSNKQLHHHLEEFESELVIFAGSFYFYVTVRDWVTSFTESR